MWDIKPGDEVVCVRDDFTPTSPWPHPIVCPERGRVYTVGRLVPKIDCLTLREIPLSGGVEPFFPVRAFRKVPKRSTETGMSILRGILDRENDGVRAPEKEKA